ncbi:hypothetical protein [Spectribacter hydrogenoxidans]|uniref:Uncharacterized protein n=1 Tax=Spectribacter hydrogenoxidans TaxID=3075608 RepID=A0ABU3BXX0_9GAMM|nr:hypothetical protein [Salinisphaera sp. W335]MDT0634085.1 hypothetical protein [Salinisphaera sp. W335]
MKRLMIILMTGLGLLGSGQVLAQGLQPYVLAYGDKTSVEDEVKRVRNKLENGDFEIVGEYSPYENAHVIGFTSPALQSAAAASGAKGGYGAVLHASVTRVGDYSQVVYLNPEYMAAAYRMDADLADVAAQLKKSVGAGKLFGTDEERTAEDLREYHYMFGMEYFDDPYELAEFDSHETAVATVEKNIKANIGGVDLVYRVDIPDAQQTLFGVSRANASDDNANDAKILRDVVDEKFNTKTTAYLPYQILVTGNKAEALHMRFRMAIWHPDLTMLTFGKIISSPGAIDDLLTSVANGGEE